MHFEEVTIIIIIINIISIYSGHMVIIAFEEIV